MKHILYIIAILLLSSNLISAQKTEENKAKIKLELNDDAKPDVYIDGKKYDYNILNLLDQDKIESLNIYKNEEAILKYNAPNGVILILSKKEESGAVATFDGDVKFKIKGSGKRSSKDSPIIIIDGEVVKKSRLKKLDPDSILKIEVFKGEEAIKKYDAPNGAIVVTTKS